MGGLGGYFWLGLLAQPCDLSFKVDFGLIWAPKSFGLLTSFGKF